MVWSTLPPRGIRCCTALALAALLGACASPPATLGPDSPPADLHYTVIGPQGQSILRLITAQASCPQLQVDGQPQTMALRAAPASMPDLREGRDRDRKAIDMPVRVCELPLPAGTRSVQRERTALPLAPAQVQRLLVLGDTGCRLKKSDAAFQPCNDPRGWPFARVLALGLRSQPDLVLHLGDYHYRESPCAADAPGCQGSPWGFGYDTWAVDFFEPARALLGAVPWVFVRGNHESCQRAGQGWFRFLDVAPWQAARSCDEPRRDADAAMSPPYAVPLDAQTQLIIFDSASVGYRRDTQRSPAYLQTLQAMDSTAALARQRPQSIFVSHHPMLAFSPGAPGQPVFPGVEGLLQPARERFGERYFAPGVDLAIHGHVHLFQALNFGGRQPATVVLGNSGSASEGALPATLPAGMGPAPQVQVQDFHTRDQFGYALLERVQGDWQLSEFDVQGQLALRCRLRQAQLACNPS